jgi:protein-tyrosine phosphatase
MDKSNLTNIFRLQTEEGHLEKIKLMREFDPLQNGEEVPDPYYGGEGGFQQVFDILDRSTETLIENLIAKD